MILPGSYANGFAPRDGRPLYPGLWRGCVGAWAPCLGPTGLTLRDWSGFGNHGTLNGTATWDRNAGSQTILCNASGEQIRATGVAEKLSGAASITVSIWVTPEAIDFNGGIISIWNTQGGDNREQFALIWWSSSNVLFTSYSTSQTNTIPSTVFSAGTRYHLAATISPTAQTVFVNGQQVAQTARSGSIQSATSRLEVGAYTGGGNFGRHHVTDWRLYNRELSSSEIRSLASRPGIAYELAPRRRSSSSGIAFNRRRRLLVGAHS